MAKTRIVCYEHSKELIVLSHTDLTQENSTINVSSCLNCLEEAKKNGYKEGWEEGYQIGINRSC